MADLELKNITKSYGRNKVIDDFNLSIKSGEFITLLGPSGCGKSTLLRMIAGLEQIDGGELVVGGEIMNSKPPQLRQIGMVFQSYALFPHMNIKNNISFGLKIQKQPEYVIFDRLQWIIPLLRLDGLEYRLPREISGGQRQRVALARSLVLNPDVLLLDEPLSNLDAALRERAMVELKRIHSNVGKTIIYVSHNQAEAMSMSEKIAVINAGNLEQFDSPTVLYDNPKTLFAAQFIGSPVTNTFSGEIRVSDGTPFVDIALGAIELYKTEGVDWASLHGLEVNVCIRPQDINSEGHKYSGNSNRKCVTAVSTTVSMVETPGDRNLVIGETLHDDTVRFFVNRSYSIEVGDKCAIEIDGELVHVFSKESNQNILNEVYCA